MAPDPDVYWLDRRPRSAGSGLRHAGAARRYRLSTKPAMPEAETLDPPARDAGTRVIHGAPAGVDARILAALSAERDVIHVAADDRRLSQIVSLVGFFRPEASVLAFPAWDCLPYDRASPNAEILAARASTLARLAGRRRGQTPADRYDRQRGPAAGAARRNLPQIAGRPAKRPAHADGGRSALSAPAGLSPGRHGARARRIRLARRPAGHSSAGPGLRRPAGFLRRRPGIDPALRSADPAHDPGERSVLC